MSEIAVNEVEMIPLNRLHPNSWNPNEQTDATFNALAAEIQEDGFDDPLQVCPCDCELIEGPHHVIIGGEHRWKAAGTLGMTELPCTVKSWDAELQKLKTVRRNLIAGDLNDAKFTKLVNSLVDDGMDKDALPNLMGFDDEAQFAKHLLKDQSERDRSWLDALRDETRQELEAVDSLSDILNGIFADYGETVPQGFMFFAYKGKTHLMVLMHDALRQEVEKMVEVLRATGGDVKEYMTEVLKHGREHSIASGPADGSDGDPGNGDD